MLYWTPFFLDVERYKENDDIIFQDVEFYPDEDTFCVCIRDSTQA